MKPGDLWVEHFRGTRYNFSAPDRICYQYPLGAGGQRVDAKGGWKELVEALSKVKGASAGRLYVTEALEVLVARRGIHNGTKGWYPHYVTSIDEPPVFPEFEGELGDLEPGDVWPGFNFHAGSHYSLSSRQWNYTLFWRLRQREAVQPLTSKHPELREALIRADWQGGGFYITEHGHVWKPMDRSKVKPRALERLKRRPAHVLHTVRLYFDYVERLPLYIGRFKDRFEIGNYQGPTMIAYEDEF